MFFCLRRYHKVHGADWDLLGLGLHDFLCGLLLLDSASEPEDQLTKVFLLRGKHLKHTVMLVLVPTEKGTHTLFVSFAAHVRVEMAHNIFTLVDGIHSSEEKSEKGCG